MDHILGELIVRWKRTAVLIALLTITLMVWVPVLIHGAFDQTEDDSALSKVPPPIPMTTQILESDSRNTPQTMETALEATQEPKKLSHTRQPDPLVRSLEVSALHSREFQSREVSHSHLIKNVDAPTPGRLILTGITAESIPPTATINGKQYTPGTSIEVRGKTYELKQIRPGTVELQRGREVILLRLEKSPKFQSKSSE